MRTHRLLIPLAVMCLASTATAQQAPLVELVPGTRVRVVAAERSAIGGIHSLVGDTLRLTLWEQPGSISVRLPEIRRLELSQGRESRLSSAWRWAWRSGLAFAGLMGAMVLPVCGAENADGEEIECDEVGAFLSQSMISGGVLGAIYGSFAPRERWVTISVPVGGR